MKLALFFSAVAAGVGLANATVCVAPFACLRKPRGVGHPIQNFGKQPSWD